jgi:hypothetical protein
MRFCILRRSARSEILVQSSSGFAELLKALLVPCVENWRGAGGACAAYAYVCWDMVNIVKVVLLLLCAEVGWNNKSMS